jgi:hypothetical protein
LSSSDSTSRADDEPTALASKLLGEAHDIHIGRLGSGELHARRFLEGL